MIERKNTTEMSIESEILAKLLHESLQKDAANAENEHSLTSSTKANHKARMRSIPQALEDIKQLDPETAISLYSIRKLCKDGVISHRKIGKKILVNYDELLAYWGMGA